MSRIDRIHDEMSESSRRDFEVGHSVLSFKEWLSLLLERPHSLSRDAAQYAADMMDHFGTYEVPGIGGPIRRFRVFDDEANGGVGRVSGQEAVQNEVYRCLREFVQRRQIDRMLLLHGPNGSAKTSIVSALVRGLEAYSRQDAGMLHRFSWVFSEADERSQRLGFEAMRSDRNLESFAHLESDSVTARIPCELNESPIFLLSPDRRMAILEEALDEAPPEERERFVASRYLLEGDLSPKSRKIHDALLAAYRGDWGRVMRHVQVERYYISRRYRQGAVTIEPQGNMDAHARQIGHANMTGLPPVLQNENLWEAFGDLVDSNAGVVEYSDFLKRPIEANKYLLTTAETGAVNLPSYTARLNVLLVGTSNENYLSAFRHDPLFSSFKARLELIRVPYLLEYDKEAEIYERQLAKLPATIAVAPFTARTAAFWTVLTRLMEPLADGAGDPRLRRVLERLTPLDKARLYGNGETPRSLGDEEKNLLRAHVEVLRREYDEAEEDFERQRDAAYEGRRGCSAREMSALLADCSIQPPGDCVTPLLVLRRLPEFLREAAYHEFLRLDPTRLGYRDPAAAIAQTEEAYHDWLRADVHAAAELVEEGEYGRLLTDYVRHLKAHVTGEKVEDPKSGRTFDPDRELMERVESLMGVEADIGSFRNAIMTRMAAFKLKNPNREIVYGELFGELNDRLRDSVFRERGAALVRVLEDVLVLETARPGSLDAERRAAAEGFRERMARRGYTPYAMVEALEFFLGRMER